MSTLEILKIAEEKEDEVQKILASPDIKLVGEIAPHENASEPREEGECTVAMPVPAEAVPVPEEAPAAAEAELVPEDPPAPVEADPVPVVEDAPALGEAEPVPKDVPTPV